MSVSVEATGDLRTVKGSMCLTATNRTGEDLSEIVLRAYPNAIQQGSVTLYGATVNGESVPVGVWTAAIPPSGEFKRRGGRAKRWKSAGRQR